MCCEGSIVLQFTCVVKGTLHHSLHVLFNVIYSREPRKFHLWESPLQPHSKICNLIVTTTVTWHSLISQDLRIHMQKIEIDNAK